MFEVTRVILYRLLMMSFTTMTQAAAKAIVTWRYNGPYALYNTPSDQRASAMKNLLDPRNAYGTIHHDNLGLMAFYCFGADGQVAGGDYETHAVDIGLGLRPDLTGQGHGRKLIRSVIEKAKAKKPGRPMRVTIASFNTRAIHTWTQAGFGEKQLLQRSSDGLGFVVLMTSY